MTMYKKASEHLQQLQAKLRGISVPESGEAAIASEDLAAELSKEADSLGKTVAKMTAKAAEMDPEKQVYGQAMRARVGQLANEFKILAEQLERRRNELKPQADSARTELALAAETAKQHREMELKKAEAEEADRAVKAQAKQQEIAAAEANKLAAEQHRVAEDAQMQREKRQAEAQAAAEVEKQRVKEVTERSRLEILRVQEEMEKKKAADVQAKEAAKTAAFRASATPLLNPECQLLHLTRGRTELDVLLHQAGGRQLVVVDYSTGWCGPCRMMEPVLVSWAREMGPRVVFIKVDAEAQGNHQLASTAGIRGYPTFHIYKHGRIVGEVVGGNRAALRTKIDQETRTLEPLSGSNPSPAVALANAMSAMKRAVTPEAFMVAAKTLLAYTANIVDHPNEPKYRRVKASNSRFKAAVGCRPHGAQCMAALGFQPIFEAAEEVLVMDNPSPELPRVKAMLEVAMGGATTATTTASNSRPADAPPAVPRVPSPAATTPADMPPAASSKPDAAGAIASGDLESQRSGQATAETESEHQDDDDLTEEEQLERAIQMSLSDPSQK